VSLLKLLDELTGETSVNPDLINELTDLERKLPVELKGHGGRFKIQ
jgi:hypothetical protein